MAVYHGCSQRTYSNDLLQKIPHLVGGILLHLGSDVGIGVESKSGAVVAQNTGQGLHVYAILERQRGECMA